MTDAREEFDTYYIRVRGKILGPFDLAKLTALRSRGQFSRAHEISTDRQVWQSASQLDHLFSTPRPSASTAPASVEEQPFASPASATPKSKLPGAQWYFNAGGDQEGPVSILDLRGMINAGRLRGDDFVWKEGMNDWTPIGNVPELQVGSMTVAALPATDSAQYGRLPDDGIHRTSGFAVASLILGILGMFAPMLGLVLGVLAVVFAAVALKAIEKSRVALGGRGLALSGLILGILDLSFWALIILYWSGVLAGFGASDGMSSGLSLPPILIG